MHDLSIGNPSDTSIRYDDHDNHDANANAWSHGLQNIRTKKGSSKPAPDWHLIQPRSRYGVPRDE